MARVWLGIVILIAAVACGRTEREPLGPLTTGGADAGIGGASSSGGGASPGASGLASVGGLAGMSDMPLGPSAVDECVQYCETSNYKLPQALCEDWNREGWEPPFCDLDWTAPCAEYCANVYETVSPACAAPLQPAIRCVAPYYAGGALSTCWLANCRAQLFTMTSACYGLREKLAAARATWQASGIADYDLAYSQLDGTRARVAVRAGSDPVVTPANALAWTVPKLFDVVEHDLQLPGGTPQVRYNADLGYVVDVVMQYACDANYVEVSQVTVAPLR